MEVLFAVVEMLRRLVQRIGPYLIVEVVLPGGTLVALLLFLYRRRKDLRWLEHLQPQRIR